MKKKYRFILLFVCFFVAGILLFKNQLFYQYDAIEEINCDQSHMINYVNQEKLFKESN
ncbi:hypothetical protein SAMN02910453_1755 [Lachnospiraceae bacterium A10]|nr:hypothetical protein SAMN02910453_1755 [Lachnospiraceae bacterium A10]